MVHTRCGHHYKVMHACLCFLLPFLPACSSPPQTLVDVCRAALGPCTVVFTRHWYVMTLTSMIVLVVVQAVLLTGVPISS